MADCDVSRKTRVALITAKYQGYEELIKSAIEDIGCEALWIDERVGNSFWAKFLTRTGIIRKSPWLLKEHLSRMAERLQEFQADVVLFVSPETLRKNEVAALRAALPTARFLLYMYDSRANRDFDQGFLDSFDLAYSFDPVDCDAFENLHHLPLFHRHEREAVSGARASSPDYEYLFIGTARTRRVRVLSRIVKKLREIGSTHFVHIYAPSLPQFIYFSIVSQLYGGVCKISRERVEFSEYLRIIARSGYVLDIEQENQIGLTIRTIDTVFSGTALATTNQSILGYDFFKHSNVTIFSESDLKLERFQELDIKEINPHFDKYHVSSWIESIISEKIDNKYIVGTSLREDSSTVRG